MNSFLSLSLSLSHLLFVCDRKQQEIFLKTENECNKLKFIWIRSNIMFNILMLHEFNEFNLIMSIPCRRKWYFWLHKYHPNELYSVDLCLLYWVWRKDIIKRILWLRYYSYKGHDQNIFTFLLKKIHHIECFKENLVVRIKNSFGMKSVIGLKFFNLFLTFILEKLS